jgi:type IV pilus assembly protein PilN
MKINLNLATRPYIELRPVYARLRVIMLVLVVLALPMLLVLRVEQVKARTATARVDQLKSNIALLQQQQVRAHALLEQPENAGVLAQADFLNELFHRKAFSWTATMSDLETTLPAGVQVLSIDPIIAPDGHVTIRLRVAGPRQRAVDVVRNLEHSRHFMAPRVASEALSNQSASESVRATVQPVSTTGGSANDVAFDILAEYRPLPNSHDKAGLAADRAAIPKSTPLPPSAPVVQSVAPQPAASRQPQIARPTHPTRDEAPPDPDAIPPTGTRPRPGPDQPQGER